MKPVDHYQVQETRRVGGAETLALVMFVLVIILTCSLLWKVEDMAEIMLSNLQHIGDACQLQESGDG